MNKVCDICGGSGSIDCMVTCSLCKETSEHVFCMPRILRPVPKVWYCEGCTESFSEDRDVQLTNWSFGEDCSLNPDKPKTSLRRELATCYESSVHTTVNVTSYRYGARTPLSRISSLKNNEVLSQMKKRSVDFEEHHSPSKCVVVSKSTANKDGRCLDNDVSGKEASRKLHRKETMDRSIDKKTCKYDNVMENEAKACIMKESRQDCLIGDAYDSPSKTIRPIESTNAVDGKLLNTRGEEGTPQPCMLMVDPDPNLSNRSISEICWEGTFHVSDTKFSGCFGVQAHFPHQVSYKVCDISEKMDANLKFNVLPRLQIFPKIFRVDPISHEDVALYFLPSGHERSEEMYMHLTEYINSNDFAMRSHVGNVELIIYPSNQLSTNSESIGMAMYLWGVFRKVKSKSPCPTKLGAVSMSNLSNQPNDSTEKQYTEHDRSSDRMNEKNNGHSPIRAFGAMHGSSNPRCVANGNSCYIRFKCEDTDECSSDVPPGFSPISATRRQRKNNSPGLSRSQKLLRTDAPSKLPWGEVERKNRKPANK